jgi:hypothetical protein
MSMSVKPKQVCRFRLVVLKVCRAPGWAGSMSLGDWSSAGVWEGESHRLATLASSPETHRRAEPGQQRWGVEEDLGWLFPFLVSSSGLAEVVTPAGRALNEDVVLPVSGQPVLHVLTVTFFAL